MGFIVRSGKVHIVLCETKVTVLLVSKLYIQNSPITRMCKSELFFKEMKERNPKKETNTE